MLELGIGVELCWPHSPQQKGAVENLVGFVKSSFFKVRRFHDQEDLAQQLIEWHREVNQERACPRDGYNPRRASCRRGLKTSFPEGAPERSSASHSCLCRTDGYGPA